MNDTLRIILGCIGITICVDAIAFLIYMMVSSIVYAFKHRNSTPVFKGKHGHLEFKGQILEVTDWEITRKW